MGHSRICGERDTTFVRNRPGVTTHIQGTSFVSLLHVNERRATPHLRESLLITTNGGRENHPRVGGESEKQSRTRRMRLLLAYARTTPPTGRKYRLRDLSDVTGLPISSIRDLITEQELRDIEQLDLDDERAEGLEKALARFEQK